MTKQMKEHEAYIREVLKDIAVADHEELRAYHLVQIGFLQHERLVHLIVTLFFAFLLVVALVVSWNVPSVLIFAVDGFLTIMLVAYIVYYYRLENTVQRWYRLYKEISKM